MEQKTSAPRHPTAPEHATVSQAALGLSHLALHGASQLTELVAEMHSTIARATLPLSRRTPDSRGAPLPYRIVSGTFTRVATLLGGLALTLHPDDDRALEAEGWLLFRAILNGVLGDKLELWDSPLALDLSIHDRDGTPMARDTLRAADHPGLVLILHGLCMNDRGWMNPAHLAFADWLEARGHTVGWLRYNSGLPIAANGRDLAAALEALGDGPPLTLIGHSMGGLVIRAASHHAEQSGHGWLGRLRNAAYLSSPHHGAPYERIGHAANSLLGLTAYTRPFMRLGNIRSAGIRDLRFGHITGDPAPGPWDTRQRDHRGPLPELPAHARHLALGGAREARHQGSWIGDGLVPVYSALGEHRDDGRRLHGAQLERVQMDDLDHIAMLSDPRLYDLLRDWLARG